MGGKSRKSGGVSKKLIQRIKAGEYSNCGKKKPNESANKNRFNLIFDED